MKKILFTLAAFIFSFGLCHAQTGNNAVSIGVEPDFLLGSYTSYYGVGIGGNVKGMLGVGSGMGQLTLTGGYSTFSSKSGTAAAGQTLSLVPILAGYRQSCKSGFYGEAQAGLGILGTKYTGGSFSQTNFSGAINAGYCQNNFDFSVRYNTEGDVISLFALRVAYNIPLKSK